MEIENKQKEFWKIPYLKNMTENLWNAGTDKGVEMRSTKGEVDQYCGNSTPEILRLKLNAGRRKPRPS